MKEKLFYLAMGALMFSSCTSEEVIEGGSEMNAISFENVVNKPSRAVPDGEEVTASDLDQFYVYGYYTKTGLSANAIQVFDGVKVSRTKNADGVWGKWDYEGTRFWVPGATYQFYAYSCGDFKLSTAYGAFSMDGTKSTDAARALKVSDYVCDYTHQHDLLYSTSDKYVALGAGATNPRVAFKFEHLLTRVFAKFTTEFPSEYNVDIKNVQITNIFNEGDFDPSSNPQWNGLKIIRTANQDPYVNLTATGQVLTATTETPALSNGVFVIPNNYTSGETSSGTVYIKFDIELRKGTDIVFSTPMSGSWSPVWNKGYKYTYNIKLTAAEAGLEAIMFTVAEDEFGKFTDGDTPDLTIQVPGATIPGTGDNTGGETNP